MTPEQAPAPTSEPTPVQNPSDIPVPFLETLIKNLNLEQYQAPGYEIDPYVYYPWRRSAHPTPEIQNIITAYFEDALNRFECLDKCDLDVSCFTRDEWSNPRLVTEFPEKDTFTGLKGAKTLVSRTFRIEITVPDLEQQEKLNVLETITKEVYADFFRTINKSYPCWYIRDFSFHTIYVHSPESWGRGAVKITTTIGILCPGDSEPEPLHLNPEPQNIPVDYPALIQRLVAEIEEERDTILQEGSTEQICPYCKEPLPRFPKTDMKCPHCGLIIHSRRRLMESGYVDYDSVLLTKEELERRDYMHDLLTHYRWFPLEARAELAVNQLTAAHEKSSGWKIDWIEAAVEAYILSNTEEEIEALRKILRKGKIYIDPILPVEKVTGDSSWEPEDDSEDFEDEYEYQEFYIG